MFTTFAAILFFLVYIAFIAVRLVVRYIGAVMGTKPVATQMQDNNPYIIQHKRTAIVP